MEISVVIPVINEEKNLIKILSSFEKNLEIEFIFVDGGSKDNTVNLIKKAGFKVILSPILRRSYQMNLGAKQAKGRVLLFLHGDTILPFNYQKIILNTVQKKQFIAGAFRFKIDNVKPLFRLLETLVNWRSQYLSLPYGDQGIFIKKEVFESIKGFSDIEIMEDFDEGFLESLLSEPGSDIKYYRIGTRIDAQTIVDEKKSGETPSFEQTMGNA